MVCWDADHSLQKKIIAVKCASLRLQYKYSVPFLNSILSAFTQKHFSFLIKKSNNIAFKIFLQKYYTYLEFLLAWYSGFKNEPCIITALCRTAFCLLFPANSAWVCLQKTRLSCSPANPESVSGNAKASFRALEISSRGARCCWLKGKLPSPGDRVTPTPRDVSASHH